MTSCLCDIVLKHSATVDRSSQAGLSFIFMQIDPSAMSTEYDCLAGVKVLMAILD